MGGSLDFAWHSDPLLIYAVILSATLFLGICVLILTIIVKHGSRLKSEKIQRQFTALINKAKLQQNKGQSFQSELNLINALIVKYKKDIAYGWVRLLEKTAKSERLQYITIATQTNMLHCIPHCLHEEGLAEKCIAIEAIGLSGFNQFIPEIKKYVYQGGISPYACNALTRLIGVEALPQIIQSYEKGVLSTTQALSAIVEVPHHLIIQYHKDTPPNPLPKQLHRYLGLQ